MSELDGVCPAHPSRAATFTCARCGDFGCDECANRVVPTAQPICPTCWSRRAQRVEKMTRDDGSYAAMAALGLGVIALVPFLVALQLAAIIVGWIALSRLKDNPSRRTMAIAGIVLGAAGLAGTFLVGILLID